ncbi:MAG: 5-carboxymethyl-2-hydroxymuconate isomerase [Rickettsiaceae bacterium]|jgi:5-carboxymethyl-2-hydroxymuconate isomerase|nr:5-carboxymethyl-2-hydroxymuconate isomerase [Rickettsiaceae bacterium]
MPHVIVEHSFAISELKIRNLLLELNKNISKSEGNFDISQCKARAVFCPNFIVADATSAQDFMHITVRIMAGRNLEIRKKLAEHLLEVTKQYLVENRLSGNQISLSVDISEMEREIYQKTLVQES